MEEILQQLIAMNENLSNIAVNQSLILEEIRGIKGIGLYDSITDVCGKLESIESQLLTIDSSIMSISL